MPAYIGLYWKERDRLSVHDGLLLLDRRIVMPCALRQNILALLHEGHQAVRRCQKRARENIWWPNCDPHIEHLVSQCAKCAETRVVRSEPPILTPTLDGPWQRLGIDLFHLKGRDVFLIADYYTPGFLRSFPSCLRRRQQLLLPLRLVWLALGSQTLCGRIMDCNSHLTTSLSWLGHTDFAMIPVAPPPVQRRGRAHVMHHKRLAAQESQSIPGSPLVPGHAWHQWGLSCPVADVEEAADVFLRLPERLVLSSPNHQAHSKRHIPQARCDRRRTSIGIRVRFPRVP